MEKLKSQIAAVWGEMSPTRRWVTSGLLVAVLAGFATVIASQTGTHWVPLGRGLGDEELKHAVTALEEKKIPVRMGEGDIVEVPESKLHEARLVISAHGGSGGTVGMELFDESNFGQSAFQEKVNYHRALEGELARTIRSLDHVESARVHLVIPKKSLFKKNQKEPTASVTLHLRRGVDMAKNQILGIRNLVANAIEGLKPGQVTIVDQRGNMLASNDDDPLRMTEDFLEMQQQREAALEAAILEVLQPVVDAGKVRVQVTAEMDFSRKDVTEKTLDPDKQVVVGEKRHEETSNSTEAKPRGVAGAAGNLPGANAGANAQNTTTQKTSKQESVQYETESRLTRTQTPGGVINRLSVAVVVGGKQKENESGETEWVGLTEEEKKDIEALAANAAGLDPTRGDTITVVSRPFENYEPGTAAEAVEPMAPWMRMAIQYGTLALLGLTFAFGVVRPVMSAMKPKPSASTELSVAGASAGAASMAAEAYQGTAQQVAAGELPEHREQEALEMSGDEADTGDEIVEKGAPEDRRVAGERLRVRAIEATHEDPERAVRIIRTWLLAEDV